VFHVRRRSTHVLRADFDLSPMKVIARQTFVDEPADFDRRINLRSRGFVHAVSSFVCTRPRTPLKGHFHFWSGPLASRAVPPQLVGVDRSALTTIRQRSFAGPGLAQFAATLVVCAGLVFLLPAPVSSDHDALTDDGSACAESPDSSRDHQWTDGVGVNAPDSCDDDDEDDDGDDDSSGGSGHAISTGERLAHNVADSLHFVHMQVDPRVSRPLDAHSLRGPPAFHQESTDADVDDDDDDDSLCAHRSVPLAAANSREPDLLPTVNAFRAASIESGPALRAPPQ
jgi:hypothetical protein